MAREIGTPSLNAGIVAIARWSVRQKTVTRRVSICRE